MLEERGCRFYIFYFYGYRVVGNKISIYWFFVFCMRAGDFFFVLFFMVWGEGIKNYLYVRGDFFFIWGFFGGLGGVGRFFCRSCKF